MIVSSSGRSFVDSNTTAWTGINRSNFFVDGGANIGATSFYFCTKNPDLRVPSSSSPMIPMENVPANLGPFHDRIEIVPRALWSTTASLKFRRSGKGESQESAISVAICLPGELADLEGVSLDDLFKRIDVPVVNCEADVEGAEKSIFGEGSLDWLGRTRNLVIELHGPSCEQAFRNALRAFTFEESHSGELTVCQNIRQQMDKTISGR